MYKYELIRENDGKIIRGNSVNYIDWFEDGRADSVSTEPKLNRSLILDIERGVCYTWLTTTLKSFEYQGEDLHFTTSNSKYVLKKIN